MRTVLALLGNYQEYIQHAEVKLRTYHITADELTQCDMLNYECSTNERYDNMKRTLMSTATLINEIEHGGRLISVFRSNPLLQAGSWQIPYIELLQPKPTRENRDGIDGIFFVTNVAMSDFLRRHPDVPFETKGMANVANPYVELKMDDVAVKFHDRHMGAVLQIETMLSQSSNDSEEK